ncbi:hypothetical protein C4577_05145 [Candidatus Parcubacteria bacterium]|nr:MAG: hypothetical protein C4577_05145 [Candidatus Parcubacteria bacterium]
MELNNHEEYVATISLIMGIPSIIFSLTILVWYFSLCFRKEENIKKWEDDAFYLASAFLGYPMALLGASSYYTYLAIRYFLDK